MAASLNQGSEHPLADAIVRAARERGLVLDKPESFESSSGIGVRGRVTGQRLALGGSAWMQQIGVSVDGLASEAEKLRARGASAIYVALEDRLIGVLAVIDPIKPGAAEALSTLKAAGLDVVMATGDGLTTARAVAHELGIDEVHADLKPADKLVLVERLQQQGHVVAMAGDGINDAPALAKADVGIAMGTGTDVAMSSAQVTLVKGDLRGIALARSLSEATVSEHEAEPRLCVLLQCARRSAGGRSPLPFHRLAIVSDDRGLGDEPELRVGDHQCLAPARGAGIEAGEQLGHGELKSRTPRAAGSGVS